MARILSFVLASLVLSASALTTPYVARSGSHMQLAARLAVREPEPIAEPASDLGLSRLTRRTKRCTKSSASSSSKPASTKAAASPSGGGAVNAAPTPTAPSTHAAPPTSSAPSKPKETPTSSASSEQPAQTGGSCGPDSLTGENSGDGTYYAPGLGACGFTNSSSDFIAAVSWELYDTFPGYAGAGSNPNNNPICGRKVQAEYNGKTVVVEIVDRCTGCACGSLDFSPQAFSQLADQSVGRIHGLQWQYL